MDRNKVQPLETPEQVADWLDESHPLAENFAAFTRIDDHLGGPVPAIRLWHAGAQLAAARRHSPRAGA